MSCTAAVLHDRPVLGIVHSQVAGKDLGPEVESTVPAMADKVSGFAEQRFTSPWCPAIMRQVLQGIILSENLLKNKAMAVLRPC